VIFGCPGSFLGTGIMLFRCPGWFFGCPGVLSGDREILFGTPRVVLDGDCAFLDAQGRF
jgi:hypothetical protein